MVAAESWVASIVADSASEEGSDMMVALFGLERVGVGSSGENIVGCDDGGASAELSNSTVVGDGEGAPRRRS